MRGDRVNVLANENSNRQENGPSHVSGSAGYKWVVGWAGCQTYGQVGGWLDGWMDGWMTVRQSTNDVNYFID